MKKVFLLTMDILIKETQLTRAQLLTEPIEFEEFFLNHNKLRNNPLIYCMVSFLEKMVGLLLNKKLYIEDDDQIAIFLSIMKVASMAFFFRNIFKVYPSISTSFNNITIAISNCAILSVFFFSVFSYLDLLPCCPNILSLFVFFLNVSSLILPYILLRRTPSESRINTNKSFLTYLFGEDWRKTLKYTIVYFFLGLLISAFNSRICDVLESQNISLPMFEAALRGNNDYEKVIRVTQAVSIPLIFANLFLRICSSLYSIHA